MLDSALESERGHRFTVDRQNAIAVGETCSRSALVGDDVADDDRVALRAQHGTNSLELELGFFAGGGRIEVDAERAELAARAKREARRQLVVMVRGADRHGEAACVDALELERSLLVRCRTREQRNRRALVAER